MKIYTTRDVAQMLGVTIRTVQNYLRDGHLPCSIKLPSGLHKFNENDMLKIRALYMEGNDNGIMD